MGNVEDLHDAVDQGESEGDEGVNCPRRESVEKLFDQYLHKYPVPFRRNDMLS